MQLRYRIYCQHMGKILFWLRNCVSNNVNVSKRINLDNEQTKYRTNIIINSHEIINNLRTLNTNKCMGPGVITDVIYYMLMRT